MDGELKKEQIDTLFVRVGLLQGGIWGGWVVQRESHPFFEGCSTTFFFALLESGIFFLRPFIHLKGQRVPSMQGAVSLPTQLLLLHFQQQLAQF
jgi:hypothetical protein